MTFVVEMVFTGTVNRPEFEDAVHQALQRHPLFLSRVEIGRHGLPSWVRDVSLQPRIDWLDESAQIECPEGDQFDNSKEAGVRIFVQQGDERVKFTFYFDHKCTDGVAAHVLCGDIFAFYANAVEGKEVAQFTDLKPILLKTRQQRQMFYGGITLTSRPNWYAWRYALKVAGIGCQKMASRQKNTGIPLQPRFGVRTRSLDVGQHKQLRDAAIAHGVTVNDIVVAELFRTLYEWNKRNNKLSSRKFKVLLPSNLRQRGDDEMPCANMTTYNFLARKPRQCRDRVQLVKSIRDDTNEIKNSVTGAEFLEAVAKGYAYKWLIPFIVSKRTTLCSAVISNVGDPTRRYTCRIPRKKGSLICGNLVLEQVGGSPPIRPNTRSAWAITTYLRKFTVSVRCDPFMYSSEDASEILDIYFEGLCDWLDG